MKKWFKKQKLRKLIIGLLFIFTFSIFVSRANAAVDAELLLNPDTTTVNVGDAFTLDVVINPGTNQVSNIDLNLTYDQTKLRLDSISASTAFSSVLASSIPGDGTASYSAATPFGQNVTTTTTYATLHFTALASAAPTTVDVADTSAAYADNDPGTDVLSTIGSTDVTINAPTYTIGGTITGLSGTLVLQNNSGDNLTKSATGFFTFATALDDAASYAVTVLTQPTGQTCNVTNGSGTVSGANVTNVSISCTTNTYTIGGTISGLGTGKSVVLQDNSADNLSRSANGSFTFNTSIAYGSNYAVSVLTQPSGQTCMVSGGSGTVSAANVTNVSVNCTSNPDTTPPVRSSGSPSGTLAAGTTNTTLSLTTDENATCRYSSSQNIAYSSMTNTFATTGGTSHSSGLTGLSSGADYRYYVRCQDSSNNPNTDDYVISFSISTTSVATASSSSGGGGGGGGKSSPSRSVKNSQTSVAFGSTLIQSGKKFTKSSPVALYFSKAGGGYYPPMKVMTSKTGAFSVSYRATKPKGKYSWYAVDLKTGKKSKVAHYTIK